MSDLTDATLAVLAEMDWPDDREASAHVEPDGYELTPPGAYWDTARDIARAALGTAEAIIRADERAKVAEELRAAYARGYGQGRDDEAAGMPVQPVETAAGAISATPESPGKHDGLGGPQCVCPRIAVHAPGIEPPRYVLGAPWGCPEHDDHDDRQEQ